MPVSLTISPITDVTGQITGVSTISRDITERKRVEQHLQAALQEKEVLIQEVHHRVKNNLQVVSSLLNLQSNTVQDAQTREAFRESRDRIKSMALIHEKLYQSTDLARIEFSEYLRDLLVELFRSYGPKASAIRLQVEAPPVRLDLNTAVPVGLILNELVSNCLKHAFPGGKSGLVRIELQTEQATQFRLAVRDNGVGFPPDFDLGNIPTLGLRLVRILISQLGGALVIQRSGEWTECLVAFKNRIARFGAAHFSQQTYCIGSRMGVKHISSVSCWIEKLRWLARTQISVPHQLVVRPSGCAQVSCGFRFAGPSRFGLSIQLEQARSLGLKMIRSLTRQIRGVLAVSAAAEPLLPLRFQKLPCTPEDPSHDSRPYSHRGRRKPRRR
ncbi:MAG: hypothetical protein DME26_07170 [Verrucomicrobia bacterium]|nr:MAG: hypothetical protein DME26_07170 [Verrucomicrobiota bacterium]